MDEERNLFQTCSTEAFYPLDFQARQHESSLRTALSSLLLIEICSAAINKASCTGKRISACPTLFARLRTFGRLLEAPGSIQTAVSHLLSPKVKTVAALVEEALLKVVAWIASLRCLTQTFLTSKVTHRTCKYGLLIFGAHRRLGLSLLCHSTH